MKNYLIGLIALFALVVVAPVDAQITYFDGDEMMKLCTAPNNTNQGILDLSSCDAFLAGAASTDLLLSVLEGHPTIACISDGTNLRQLRRSFINFMNQKPELWNLSAANVALYAFAVTWPCKE